jgi:hypothetical protein
MNIGVFYCGFGDPAASGLLYPVANGQVEFLNGFGDETRHHFPESFKVTDGEHCFHFTRDFDEIEYCDIRVGLASLEHLTEYLLSFVSKVDWYIVTKTDGEVGQNIPYQSYLDRYPNFVIISSHNAPPVKDHPRMVIDRAINLFYFYNVFGFHWLNYYSTKEKQHLIGVYNRYDSYKQYRTKILNLIAEYSDQPYYRFDTKKNFYTELTGKVFDKWSWQQMHMTSYTDYNTAVANVVYESSMGSAEFDNVTEKTLKSIIFQKAKIFFIHFGTYNQLEWLHSKGFWFLNSEFYDPDRKDYPHHFPTNYGFNDPRSLPVAHSVCDTFKFLKKLKDELGTDTAVYNFLLEKYGDKLEASANAFDKLLSECEYKDRLLNLITSKR